MIPHRGNSPDTAARETDAAEKSDWVIDKYETILKQDKIIKEMYCTSARQNQVYKPSCHLFQACETMLTMFIYFLNFRRKLDVDMLSKSPLLVKEAHFAHKEQDYYMLIGIRRRQLARSPSRLVVVYK